MEGSKYMLEVPSCTPDARPPMWTDGPQLRCTAKCLQATCSCTCSLTGVDMAHTAIGTTFYLCTKWESAGHTIGERCHLRELCKRICTALLLNP
jgi:hypothetical protein